jgi:hypothetical protein
MIKFNLVARQVDWGGIDKDFKICVNLRNLRIRSSFLA